MLKIQIVSKLNYGKKIIVRLFSYAFLSKVVAQALYY